jgi:hypothetical protein
MFLSIQEDDNRKPFLYIIRDTLVLQPMPDTVPAIHAPAPYNISYSDDTAAAPVTTMLWRLPDPCSATWHLSPTTRPLYIWRLPNDAEFN